MVSLIPAACAALLCAAVPDAASAAAPGMMASEIITSSFGSAVLCVQPNGSRSADAARRTGPLGWLMRQSREEDETERTRLAAPISYYLRSPLLTSFFAVVPCPQNSEKRADGGAEECATVVVRRRDRDETLEVPLPQLGATNAQRLRAVVSEHQARGDLLHLSAGGYADLELPASAIREIQARPCR
jgi:hypothetical protein